jgi:hypothetical protein
MLLTQRLSLWRFNVIDCHWLWLRRYLGGFHLSLKRGLLVRKLHP